MDHLQFPRSQTDSLYTPRYSQGRAKKGQFRTPFLLPAEPDMQDDVEETRREMARFSTQPIPLATLRSPLLSVPPVVLPGQPGSDQSSSEHQSTGRQRGLQSKASVRKSHPSPKPPPRRRKRLRRRLMAGSVLVLIAILLISQGNGSVGAWFADTSRAVLGPTVTAQIEAWYLGGTDLVQRVMYQFSGQHVAAPWQVKATVTPRASSRTGASSQSSMVQAMTLPPMTPVVTPAIAGEGTWLIQDMAPAPYDTLPLVAKAFYRPDPSHPYAIVTLQQFDSRFLRLHLVAGTQEPGGPRGKDGPGAIPAADQQGNALLAAFNGGFKYADGQYGMAVNGTVYVPPQPGAATLAVTREGQIILGAWGVDPSLHADNPDLAAWRQNASLLIDRGMINPLTKDGAAWGGTILNSAYTWRSGIGMTSQGTLIYAAGNALTALTLAKALSAAGAVMAMQTDINPFWVRAFLYSRNSQGTLGISKLNPAMQGNGTEYLRGTARDFVYLTRMVPSHPPKGYSQNQN